MSSKAYNNAVLQAVIAQRNRALDDYVMLAAECAQLKARIAQLEKEKQDAVDGGDGAEPELDGGDGDDGELE